ncbi:MAG: DM13 domain-containing protein [Myxococcales bacterium]|nr:DM13 domain-containing protein [Myxococcales bacterium]
MPRPTPQSAPTTRSRLHLGTQRAACALVLACACAGGTSGDDAGAHPEGQALYAEPIADGNSFTCATCHALSEPASDGLRRPGHAIGDATRRPSWKNGQLGDMRDAVNSCLVEWMNAEPWTADDPRYQQLFDYLDAQAPAGDAQALSFTIAQPPADLTGGDADAGKALFNASCSVCHGVDGTGTTQAPPVSGQGQPPDYVARRVRTSGRADSSVYNGLTGGVMPFWAADRLSDAELRDLVAYLALVDEPMTTSDGTDSDGTDSGTTTSGGDCPTTSARIGWVAALSNNFHGVGGTAEIVDDCTVVISNFTYDGTGIDVRIYGAQGGDYDNGFPMTGDLLKAGGYNGATLVATLPDGESMDALDGISVWCVDVGVDFGSGAFAPP